MDLRSHQLRVQIPVDGTLIEGDLSVPEEIHGGIIFAHGSGSSRTSPRNRYVAEVLQSAGFATLLLDLLTEDEELLDRHTARLRFNIPFLAKRLSRSTEWLREQQQFQTMRTGYFGASTGAAAALVAAAHTGNQISAVVSRGGRPDLAGEALRSVKAPTLLIVGADDQVVLDLNYDAISQLECEKNMEIVPGASHLFEEPGALEQVTRLARDWFDRYLGSREQSIQVA
jgi:dienelactone hydrolase